MEDEHMHHFPTSNFDDVEDRISALPGHIRQHILSFLDTKDAFTTSILSRTWRYDWLSVPYINLGRTFFHQVNRPFDNNRYPDFIDQALIKNNDKFPTIQRLGVYIPPVVEIVKNMEPCLEKLKVKELHCRIEYAHAEDKSIPRCVFTTPNITHLYGMCFTLPRTISSELNLPNLRELDLEEVDIGQEIIDSIITKCTSIQTLTLLHCTGFNSLRIYSLPALKSLQLEGNSNLKTTEVDTPNLEELCWRNGDREATFTLVSTEKSLTYLELQNYFISGRDWISCNLSIQLSHIKKWSNRGSNVLDHIASARTEMGCLESLTIWISGSSSQDLGHIGLYSLCVNLKHLNLEECYQITDDWLNQQIAQLRNLESLKIDDCEKVVYLKICHMRLTTLCLKGLEKLERVDIDCPNLRTFSYRLAYTGSRSIMSLNASSELRALTSCEILLGSTKGNDKLHQLLKNLRHSRYMTLIVYGDLEDISTWSRKKYSFDRPPLSEANIKLTVEFGSLGTGTLSNEQLHNIIESLLLLCPRPQVIRLRRKSGKECYVVKFKDRDEAELDNVKSLDRSFRTYEIVKKPAFEV